MSISRLKCALSAVVFLCLSALPLTARVSFASTIYTYTEESGTQAFTTELNSIPEKYRSQVIPLDFDTPLESPSPVDPTPPVSTEPPPPSENARTVTASGEYRMGDHDTKADAVRLAIEAAKKDALEQVATYLESVTEVRNMDLTRDDIRTYTAGIVHVLEQTITTRLEDETVVVRADLTAVVDPNEVAQAIAVLRRNESARSELTALRAEADQLQQQLDAANRALADAPSPEQLQELSRQRQDMLDELQANALVSQAWTSSVYVSPGMYAYPWIGVQGINGLLIQAQRLYPRHRHLPRAQQFMTTQAGNLPPAAGGTPSPPPRHRSLLVPSTAPQRAPQSPPLLTPSGVPAKVGDIVSIPTPRSVAPVPHQSSPQSQHHQLHPSHFWRPSPPNIHTAPSVPQPSPSVSPRHFGGHGKQFGGGGRSGGRHFRGGGHRGR